MTAVELIILILCVNQIIETFHHGSLFAELRARAEACEGFLAELLQCMFCLSHWVAGFVVAWFLTVWLGVWWFELDDAVGHAALFPIYGFAACRGAQLLNDAMRPWSRTPLNGLPPLDDRLPSRSEED